jgi:hypothetical protein
LFSEEGLADEPLLHARVAKAGLRVGEVPHLDMPRLGGDSKAPSWRQGFGAIKDGSERGSWLTPNPFFR